MGSIYEDNQEFLRAEEARKEARRGELLRLSCAAVAGLLTRDNTLCAPVGVAHDAVLIARAVHKKLDEEES